MHIQVLMKEIGRRFFFFFYNGSGLERYCYVE